MFERELEMWEFRTRKRERERESVGMRRRWESWLLSSTATAVPSNSFFIDSARFSSNIYSLWEYISGTNSFRNRKRRTIHRYFDWRYWNTLKIVRSKIVLLEEKILDLQITLINLMALIEQSITIRWMFFWSTNRIDVGWYYINRWWCYYEWRFETRKVRKII